MNIKKIYLTMTIASITISPFVLLASCSSVTYVTLIPKISETKIIQIQDEIAKDGVTKWIQDRSVWSKEQWLLAHEPVTGYIGGGNVVAKNILEIKVSILDDKINFFISVDKNSKNRFLDNKTEWTAQVPQEKTINHKY
ncbi:MAG: hypothetical protein ACRC1F_02955 [Metamycoplasmataceae bacterium]